MKPLIPQLPPKVTRAETEAAIAPFKIDRKKYPLVYVTFEEYYPRLSSGRKKGADYNDAAAILSPDRYVTFNVTTDAAKSKHALGIPRRLTGIVYAHCIDLHKGDYPALCQRLGNIPYKREKTGDIIHFGMVGHNSHKGYIFETGSEMCTTTPPTQWPSKIDFLVTEAKMLWGEKLEPFNGNPKDLRPAYMCRCIPWVHFKVVNGEYLDTDGNPQPKK